MMVSVASSLKYWLLLLRAPGIGSKTFLNTLDSYQPEQLFKQSHSRLAVLGLKDQSIDFIKNPDWTLIEQDLDWLKQQGNSVLTINDALYPYQLKQIDNPPPLLFVRGNEHILSQRQIAIVGSRNPSASGLQTATAFAKSLSQAGF
ncbi:MAG TPA: DNA-processing protein DprA, partial [Methylococcaceae bacterium]|nr:DNA-processing protein DprA [Methylococcaceae bacterium]